MPMKTSGFVLLASVPLSARLLCYFNKSSLHYSWTSRCDCSTATVNAGAHQVCELGQKLTRLVLYLSIEPKTFNIAFCPRSQPKGGTGTLVEIPVPPLRSAPY